MFFHVCSPDRRIGEVITPGHWGANIRRFQPGGPMPTPDNIEVVLWEMALEAARVAVNTSLPSRLDCIFAWPDQRLAERFQAKYRPGFRIAVVVPNGPTAPFHSGDFALISDQQPQAAYTDYMASAATRYWTSNPSDFPEVLYPGELSITALL
jgi:hypothetical protein